jgi:predicted transcriptional regulator
MNEASQMSRTSRTNGADVAGGQPPRSLSERREASAHLPRSLSERREASAHLPRSLSERRPAGALEAEVLRALWDAGVPLTPTQLQERMHTGLAYNTVHTVLTRLCDKGVVARTRRAGRAAYQPVQAQVEHGAAQLRAVLDAARDRGEVLRRFVDTLTPQEEAALRAWLRDSGD